jgi:hypothetical protein
MRYNFACALNTYLRDREAALEMVMPLFAAVTDPLLRYLKSDPDLVSLQDEPRFQAMITAAEARLAATKDPDAPAVEVPA